MPAPASLDQLTRSYLDLRWHFDPVDGSGAGVAAHDARLGCFTTERVRAHVAAVRAVHNAIEDLELDDRDDEIDRTALLNDARVAMHRFTVERPHERNPGFWTTHLLEGLYQPLITRDRPAADRARAAEDRLRAVPGFFDEARATLGNAPHPLRETAAQAARAGLGLVDELAAALVPADAETFAGAAVDARAALERFAVEQEAAVSEAPADGYAVGEDALNYRLSFQHAVQARAAEVLRYGRHLVEEVEARLEALAGRMTGGARWRDLADRLRHATLPDDQVLGAYTTAVGRARAFVEERGLASIPEGVLEVAPTPAFLRPVIPRAAYLPPGPMSADRSGRFFVTVPRAGGNGLAGEHAQAEIPGTALHEGYPGHHLHFLTAQAQPRLVRQVVYSPLTVEGWALYCEGMMGEEGFYASPEERFFELLALLWRAFRVVLDVGLHTGALPYAEAVRAVGERLGVATAEAEAEVRATCMEPGYALAYALGRRELLALRDAYREARGAAYSLRAFHDDVLAYGGLPVSLMRWGIGVDG